ncbi:uncharacterized protein [Venturia canescens]|uniref:uncharacterized protein n=1 Tax=Venturia canescens TaxID=32260 RepID=UPI001C9CF31E|nr:uncharacterized protein LOC122412293 [Venturia canescens]XP_043277680.1 uncharacterized protein LOC122412293 [Venturia canescens]XP_043277681.1 uncharacterized protein LOC122412293 [Venturia canescens]
MVAKNIEDGFGSAALQNTSTEYAEVIIQHRMRAIEASLSNCLMQVESLKEDYECLESKIDSLKDTVASIANVRNVSHAGQVVLSGIPPDCTLSPETILKKVFEALDIGERSTDIITMRIMVKRGKNQTEQSQEPFRAPCVALLVSDIVRDYVLEKRRAKKNFVWSQVLEDCSPAFGQSTVYLNEMLPPSTYRLFRQAKRNMAQLGYSYVWHKNGHVYAKKSHGQPRIILKSIEDMVP